jgi:signal transduction histidine kinase
VPPLKYALEDLRLIIDSLDPSESAFDAVFSALRVRFARTASSLGLRFAWNIDPAVADLDPNPHEVLMVARVVQEAVTNVIKHARASSLSVSGSVDPDGYVNIAVADDGVGGVDHVNGRGRGLTSMRSRARELGGELVVEPLEPGTCVSLRWRPDAKD